MAENELIGLFDTHAHPTDERFDEDRTEFLARMRQADMLCMCVGADMAYIRMTRKNSRKRMCRS